METTLHINAVSSNVDAVGIEVNAVDPKSSIELPDDLNIPELEDIVYLDDDEDVGAEADMNNLDAFMLDLSWIEGLQDELLQFKLQKVWTLVDLPNGKRAISTKWVYRNKKDKRGIVIKNKARLVAQGYTQEEGIDYDEMDVKSSFLYGKIEEEVYVSERKDRQEFVYQKGQSQDKYVIEILKKFGFTNVKIASTPMETQKLLLKDEDGEEVDVHLYRSMIGSLMYLTSSRPDIIFAVCACARYQVNPKVSHLQAVKRIFSDYVGASLDRKSTTGGCQFLGCKLTSWQCKKQIVVANSTIKVEYVAASSCCGQVLWIRNQLLDYGDCNEKKLFQMVKIHTDKNVADLLTKAFDASRIERVGENKNRKRDVWNKNRQRVLVSKGIKRSVNAARHNLLLLLKVNAARHNLLLLLKVNAARHNLLLLLKVNAARHKLTTAIES
ncbi:putative reverse transcriptase, RNA-dependent DNA polymerase [Tanacetum coccineum]